MFGCVWKSGIRPALYINAVSNNDNVEIHMYMAVWKNCMRALKIRLRWESDAFASLKTTLTSTIWTYLQIIRADTSEKVRQSEFQTDVGGLYCMYAL